MEPTKKWTVDVLIAEDDVDRVTHAEVSLRGPGGAERHGTGFARRNPIDAAVPEIGDELAVARALSALAHEMLHAAVDDIQTATREKVTLSSR